MTYDKGHENEFVLQLDHTIRDGVLNSDTLVSVKCLSATGNYKSMCDLSSFFFRLITATRTYEGSDNKVDHILKAGICDCHFSPKALEGNGPTVSTL